jgi:hypothetical protein
MDSVQQEPILVQRACIAASRPLYAAPLNKPSTTAVERPVAAATVETAAMVTSPIPVAIRSPTGTAMTAMRPYLQA